MKNLIIMLARICLSLIFIVAAVNKVLNWEETERYFATTLSDWATATVSTPFLHDLINRMIPHTHPLLLIAALFEGVGGLLVLLGIQPRFGAFLLLLFIIPTTILMHAFWIADVPNRDLQMIMFLKNLSILGGLLLLLTQGGKAATSLE